MPTMYGSVGSGRIHRNLQKLPEDTISNTEDHLLKLAQNKSYNHSKPTVVDDVVYASTKDAAEVLGVSCASLSKVLRQNIHEYHSHKIGYPKPETTKTQTDNKP